MRHAGTRPIQTNRLTLRQIELADAEMMFRHWASDPDVSRYMRWEPHKTALDTENVIQNWCNNYQSDNYYHWGICLKSGEIIGSAGVFSISEHDLRAEISYCIGKKWWGQGYTAEAVKAVIDYMFQNTGLERIEAYHSVQNPASGRVMAKAGMTHEGFSKHKYKNRDGFQDCDLYGVIRDEWKNSDSISQL